MTKRPPRTLDRRLPPPPAPDEEPPLLTRWYGLGGMVGPYPPPAAPPPSSPSTRRRSASFSSGAGAARACRMTSVAFCSASWTVKAHSGGTASVIIVVGAWVVMWDGVQHRMPSPLHSFDSCNFSTTSLCYLGSLCPNHNICIRTTAHAPPPLKPSRRRGGRAPRRRRHRRRPGVSMATILGRLLAHRRQEAAHWIQPAPPLPLLPPLC